MIYILTFIVSLICIKISMMTSEKNKIFSKIFEIIGILIPCLLAALRDYTIGTDVEIYVHPLFIAAGRSTSFTNYYISMTGVTDFLYLLVTYICSRISQDIGVLFFILELLVILPIYIALKKRFKNSNCVILGLLLLFLFFYNQSYNMVRQSIAISFITLGLLHLDHNENKRFFLCLIIAQLFHNTALIFILVFILYKFISSKKINPKIKLLIEIIIIIAGVTSIFILPKIIDIVGKIGFINIIKSEVYLTKYIRTNVDVSFIHTAIYLFVIIIVFMYKKRIKNYELNATYYLFASAISIVVLQLGAVVSYAERIGYYVFYPILITIVPYIIYKEKERITKKDFYILVFVVSVFALYWFVWIYLLNYNATVPYIFR